MSEDLFPKIEDETPDEVARIRLPMAQRFVRMVLAGYDALLNYGINFRELPEYKDQSLLDKAASLPLRRGQETYIEWVKRVESGIAAAIRRKLFNRVK